MTLSRLITWMCGVSPRAVEALPPFEKAQLAAQCRRLLSAAEAPPPPKAGLLAELRDPRGRS
jgi:hypothetical protein